MNAFLSSNFVGVIVHAWKNANLFFKFGMICLAVFSSALAFALAFTFAAAEPWLKLLLVCLLIFVGAIFGLGHLIDSSSYYNSSKRKK